MTTSASPLAWHPLAALLLAGVLIATFGAVMAWRRRAAPGALSLVVLQLGLVIWSGSYALSVLAVDDAVSLFFLRLLYLGVVLVPASFLLFSLELGRAGTAPRRRWAALLLVEPVLLLAVVASDPLHGQFILDPHRVNGGVMAWGRGPLYGAHLVYSYALLGAGVVIQLRRYRRTTGPYRKQLLWALAATAVGWSANAIGLAVSAGSVDLSPVFTAGTAACIVVALRRYGMLDLVPVARAALVDNLPDAVLVLDGQGRVVDLNDSALALVERTSARRGGAVLGASVGDLWPGSAELLWTRLARADGSARVSRMSAHDRDGLPVHVDVRSVALRGSRGSGLLLIVRDITDEVCKEQALAEAVAALRDEVATVERLRGEMQEQARRDPLTGMVNRRELDRVLARSLATAAREAEPVSVVLLDVDHFKSINDRFGHGVGDGALVGLARVLADSVPAGATVGRWGGEEFLAVLPGFGASTAAAEVERWRCALRAAADRLPAPLTFSAGVAEAPPRAVDVAALVAVADSALYSAKGDGRDCVVAAGPLPSPRRRADDQALV